jgi:hypothetical protein
MPSPACLQGRRHPPQSCHRQQQPRCCDVAAQRWRTRISAFFGPWPCHAHHLNQQQILFNSLSLSRGDTSNCVRTVRVCVKMSSSCHVVSGCEWQAVCRQCTWHPESKSILQVGKLGRFPVDFTQVAARVLPFEISTHPSCNLATSRNRSFRGTVTRCYCSMYLMLLLSG